MIDVHECMGIGEWWNGAWRVSGMEASLDLLLA
jgi:hypothetical protein